MTNSAYTRLWDTEDTEALHDVYVADATASWKAHCAPTTVWREFCACVLGGSDRKEWSASVRLLNGNEVTFDCRPMPGGATLVRFAQEARSQGNLMPIGA